MFHFLSSLSGLSYRTICMKWSDTFDDPREEAEAEQVRGSTTEVAEEQDTGNEEGGEEPPTP